MEASAELKRENPAEMDGEAGLNSAELPRKKKIEEKEENRDGEAG